MNPPARERAVGEVLIVDDHPPNVDLVTLLMTRLGYVVRTAADGEAALAAVAHHLPDIVLLDVNLPTIDGFEVCSRLKRDPLTRLLPVVLITGLSATEDRVRGIEAGADDFITKPFNRLELEARVRTLTRLKRHTDDLESAEAVILSLGLTIEARDPYTQWHCQHLADYAATLGAHLDLDDDQRRALNRGAFLHDLGKVGIPDAILLKPGPLTAAEFALMQQHTTIGHRLCGELRSLEAVRPIVRHHHERLDGTGYPDQLKGDAIPLLAQIISVVDLYDAMTTDRPYRSARSPEEAFEALLEEARKGWKRADLVEAFIALGSQGRLATP